MVGVGAVRRRHPGKGGIDFGEAVSAAAGVVFTAAPQQLEAGLVVTMRGIEGGDEDGGVEKISHSKPPAFLRSRLERVFRRASSASSWVRGLPEVKTQMPSFLCIGEE